MSLLASFFVIAFSILLSLLIFIKMLEIDDTFDPRDDADVFRATIVFTIIALSVSGIVCLSHKCLNDLLAMIAS